jgi:RNA polymerase sigma-70 factor (ECF subfamily)
VLALVLVEGLSYAEAAQALDVPVGTVTSRLARGRAALQRLLGEE